MLHLLSIFPIKLVVWVDKMSENGSNDVVKRLVLSRSLRCSVCCHRGGKKTRKNSQNNRLNAAFGNRSHSSGSSSHTTPSEYSLLITNVSNR